MNPNDKNKPVSLDLPEELHVSMKAAAPLRGVTLREAYIEAAENWLKAGEGRTANTVEIEVPRELADMIRTLVSMCSEPASEVIRIWCDGVRKMADLYRKQQAPPRKNGTEHP